MAFVEWVVNCCNTHKTTTKLVNWYRRWWVKALHASTARNMKDVRFRHTGLVYMLNLKRRRVSVLFFFFVSWCLLFKTCIEQCMEYANAMDWVVTWISHFKFNMPCYWQTRSGLQEYYVGVGMIVLLLLLLFSFWWKFFGMTYAQIFWDQDKVNIIPTLLPATTKQSQPQLPA